MPLSGTPITPVAGLGVFYPPATGTVVASADVKALAQATANRFSQIAKPVVKENYDDTLATAYELWAAATATYTDSDGGSPLPSQFDVPSLIVGDVLIVDAAAILLFAVSVGGPDVALFQLHVVDDNGGATVSHVYPLHWLIDLPASTTRHESRASQVRHVVTNAGTTRIRMQARSINYNGTTIVNQIAVKSYRFLATPMRP